MVWPVIRLFLLTRYRTYLRSFLDSVAARLLKLGPFELTPKSDVIALDPADTDESTEHHDPQDIERIERLFEFISDDAGFGTLSAWLNEHVEEALEIGDFLTLPEYASRREEAYRAVVEGEGR